MLLSTAISIAAINASAAETQIVSQSSTAQKATKPKKVTNVKQTKAELTKVTVKWSSVSKSATYQAKILLNGKTAKEKKGIKGTTYQFTGLNNSTTYQVQVRAVDNKKKGDWSSKEKVYTKGKVSGLKQTGSANETSAKIAWNQTSSDAEYSIALLNTSGKVLKKYNNIGKTESYTINGLSKGTSYKVQAQAITGGFTGPWCSSKVIRTISNVSNVSQSSMDTTSIGVSWSKSSNESTYELALLNTSGKVLKKYSANKNTSYTITGLTPGTIYKVQVRALNGTYGGDWSEPLSVATTQSITSIEQTGCTPASLTYKWTKFKSGYSFQAAITDDEGEVTTKSVSTNSVTFSGLSAGKVYKAQVRVKYDKTYSKWSSPVSVVVGCNKVSKLTQQSSYSNKSGVTFSWKASNNANEYRIYVLNDSDYDDYDEDNEEELMKNPIGYTNQTSYTIPSNIINELTKDEKYVEDVYLNVYILPVKNIPEQKNINYTFSNMTSKYIDLKFNDAPTFNVSNMSASGCVITVTNYSKENYDKFEAVFYDEDYNEISRKLYSPGEKIKWNAEFYRKVESVEIRLYNKIGGMDVYSAESQNKRI